MAESALDEMQALFEALEEAEADLVSRTSDNDLSQVQQTESNNKLFPAKICIKFIRV